jgi:hypothetical protein
MLVRIFELVPGKGTAQGPDDAVVHLVSSKPARGGTTNGAEESPTVVGWRRGSARARIG